MNRLANLVVLFGCCILQIIGDPDPTNHSNDFDDIQGCKQYDDVLEYDASPKYFLTDGLKNTRNTHDTKTFKFGVVGASDGIIRFSNFLYPYGHSVTEIVISASVSSKCIANKQVRTAAGVIPVNTVLADKYTPNLLSKFKPTMFKVELRGTYIALMKFEDSSVLFNYSNPDTSVKYMAFAKKTADMIYFYDCPWEKKKK